MMLPWYCGLMIWALPMGEAETGVPELPQPEEVIKGYNLVAPPVAGQTPLYNVYTRPADNQMLLELPNSYPSNKYFLALTVASGDLFAGLQAGDLYFYWKRLNNRLALVAPNVGVRSTGDKESQNSVQRLFTDRVILDVPILAARPSGEVVIDLDHVLLDFAATFFGYEAAGLNRGLAEIQTVKAFPQNVEVSYKVPVADGILKTFHYSFSLVPQATGYNARLADSRVGYFTTSYRDLGKYKDDETTVRYINRWFLEKAAPDLKISPPKQPIVFYLEHTTPVRYRRFVREGVEYWNRAFEKIGLVNAIEVYQQDASTGVHMDKDPEDVRFNFIRWLNNDVGTAIGPSRVHPETGQILDADIILTDGWIRYFEESYSKFLPKLAMEGMHPETLVWLERHPQWDPRYLLAPAAERNLFLRQLAARGPQPLGGHPLGQISSPLLGDEMADGLLGRHCQVNGMCLCADGRTLDLSLLRASWSIQQQLLAQAEADAANEADKVEKPDEKKDDKDKKEEPTEDVLDGIPASFIGPLLADLVAHEVGHTLGLRHNFKASALYKLSEINSDKLKQKLPFTASVMDYTPININMQDGELQGDFAMINIGPYDEWAIEYGYSFSEDLKPILARSVEPALQFSTDEDTMGPDPLARRYDFSQNPLDFARSQIRLAEYHRKNLIERFVDDGQSWDKARKGYEMTLGLQLRAIGMMSNWIGGAFVRRDKKGDTGNREPIEVVPAALQRDALNFVLEHTFRDEAFGLTPALLRRLGNEIWLDNNDWFQNDSDYPVHDRIIGIQGSVLTQLMNPTTLRRVYDNEYRLENDQDAFTLPELLNEVKTAVWKELTVELKDKASVRRPAISSLRRNIQKEHIQRLIDLATPGQGTTAATKPIADLAMQHLRELKISASDWLNKAGDKIDPYTGAHLHDATIRIGKFLDSQHIFNANDLSGGGGMILLMLGKENQTPPAPNAALLPRQTPRD